MNFVRNTIGLLLLSVASGRRVVASQLPQTATANACEAAEYIVVGTVHELDSNWVDEDWGTVIATRATISVEVVVVGPADTQWVTVDYLGGTIGDIRLDVGGHPSLRLDERFALVLQRKKANTRVLKVVPGVEWNAIRIPPSFDLPEAEVIRQQWESFCGSAK